MRIKKVKIQSDDRILIVYEQKNNTGKIDELSLNCAERAEPTFYKSLQALNESVAEICEIDKPEKIIVTGITFSYSGEKEVMGAVITAQRKLLHSNCPLNLNTPHKIETFHAEKGDDKQLLPEKSINLLYKVHEECERYINGNREQQKLDI